MTAIATLLRLGFAAVLAGAVAGLLLTFSLFIATKLDFLIGRSGRFADFWPMAAIAVPMGIAAAGLPALLAGATLWWLGRRQRAARHALAWAGAGAVVGASFWALLELAFWTPGGAARFNSADVGLLLACLIAGAGGALAFRAAMTATEFMEG